MKYLLAFTISAVSYVLLLKGFELIIRTFSIFHTN